MSSVTDTSITLGADSVRAELDEAPEAHDLTAAQIARIEAMSDEDINAAIRSEVDDDFWAQYDDVRRRSITRLAGDPLVNIVHLAGDDYDHAVDVANNNGGSTEAVVAYLAQWDYGDEIDAAAEINGYTQLDELHRLPHQVHDVTHHGTQYWLQLDHGLRFYSLYRRPGS